MAMHAMRRGGSDELLLISTSEEKCFRLCYGRYGDPEGRDLERGSASLLDYAGRLGGHCWFTCDCRTDDPKSGPPLMTLVKGDLIRPHLRNMDGDGRTLHAQECDFGHDQDDQRDLFKSFERRAISENHRRLPIFPKSLAEHEESDNSEGPHRHRRLSYARPRPPLGALLAELMFVAGLQIFSHDESYLDIKEQYGRLKNAAAGINLSGDVKLSEYFLTYAPALDEFRARIQKAPPRLFSPNPPHGILLTIVDRVEDNVVVPRLGERFAVPTTIPIFNETSSDRNQRNHTGPFVGVFLFASLAGEAAQAVRCYLHPVLSAKRLLLVASEFERHCLGQMLFLQKGMAQGGSKFNLEKPLFPVSSVQGNQRTMALPAFIAKRVSPLPTRSVPVECISSTNERYLAYKKLVDSGIRDFFGVSPVVHHRYLPVDDSQEDRDATFRKLLRRALLSQTL